MISIAIKAKDSLRREGPVRTARKVLAYPLNRMRLQRFAKRVLILPSTEERFTAIYNINYWNSDESISGRGSTLKFTENLRKELPKLLSTFSIKEIFDAPCGDFNWMKHLLPLVDVNYIGGDIVLPLIESNSKKYAASRIAFYHIDLTKDVFPQADLMICRDCLVHLSYSDTKSVLKNFVASGIPFLLTTTHKNSGGSFSNKDIPTGGYRFIDLFSAPYNFPRNPLSTIDDWSPPEPERQMCLWSREQVASALSSFN